MITFLEGRIESVDSDGIVLLCGGIGFRLLCSARTLERMTPRTPRTTQDEEVRLFVVLQARDGDLKLYGFFEASERDAFQLLLSVQGIGGKLALAVLSQFDSAAFARAITQGDKASLQAVSGLGARTAQRLIVELEGKTDALLATFETPAREGSAQPSVRLSADERLWHDLADALGSLGFERLETTRTLQALRRAPPPENLNEALRQALKMLRPHTRPPNFEVEVENNETAATTSPTRR